MRPTSPRVCSSTLRPKDIDRKSTRLNSRHLGISYAVFCLEKKERRYALHMTCAPLENLDEYDCVVIFTDHSDYDYRLFFFKARRPADIRTLPQPVAFPN